MDARENHKKNTVSGGYQSFEMLQILVPRTIKTRNG